MMNIVSVFVSFFSSNLVLFIGYLVLISEKKFSAGQVLNN